MIENTLSDSDLGVSLEPVFGADDGFEPVAIINLSGSHGLGSPLDYIEDTFLQALDAYQLHLCSEDGSAIATMTQLQDGTSYWFTKLTVYESAAARKNTASYDRNHGDWFRRVGSWQFSAWPHRPGAFEKWATTYPEPPDGADISKLLSQARYHTLPMCWERVRYTVVEDLPPWSKDALDTAFIDGTVRNCAGRTFCLSKDDADRWRRRNQRRIVNPDAGSDIFASHNKTKVKQGKTAAILDAEWPGWPDVSSRELSWFMEKEHKYKVSYKTIDRMKKSRRGEKS